MTYYDLIKKYGKGLGSDNMWNAVRRVSNFIEPIESVEPKKFWKFMKGTYYDMAGGHFDSEFAEWQIKEMFYIDDNGVKKFAPYWSSSTVMEVYDKIRSKIKNKDYNAYDFMVVLNMIKSDNYMMYKRWWPDATQEELDNKFVETAVNWLNDDDSPFGSEKAWLYFNS